MGRGKEKRLGKQSMNSQCRKNVLKFLGFVNTTSVPNCSECNERRGIEHRFAGELLERERDRATDTKLEWFTDPFSAAHSLSSAFVGNLLSSA